MKNKHIKVTLFTIFLTLYPISETIANGKWVRIYDGTLLNLNNYERIQVVTKKRQMGASYKSCGIEFKGRQSFFVQFKCISDPPYNEPNDAFEEIVDFIDDDDEYMELD